MAGLNFLHAVAQAWEAGKLFHIDLNDQDPGRYDQDFRFGAANLKAAFFLVKFLEDVGYDGPRHFDAHAYRTEDYAGVQDFAARLHAHLPDPQGARRALDGRHGDPGHPPGRPGGQPARAGAVDVLGCASRRAFSARRSIARAWLRAAWATSGSIS